MSLQNYVGLIEDACALALARTGIVMKKGVGSVPLSGDFSGWLGLNAGVHENFIRINPFVGVHGSAIMKMAAKAGGKKYKPNELATYSVFLGTLCPDVKQFIFTVDSNVVAEAERLSSAIAEFGIPYMHKIASYQTLLPLLEARIPSLGGYPQRYAAALYASGERERAIEFIDNQIPLLKNDDVPEVIAALDSLKKMMLEG